MRVNQGSRLCQHLLDGDGRHRARIQLGQTPRHLGIPARVQRRCGQHRVGQALNQGGAVFSLKLQRVGRDAVEGGGHANLLAGFTVLKV